MQLRRLAWYDPVRKHERLKWFGPFLTENDEDRIKVVMPWLNRLAAMQPSVALVLGVFELEEEYEAELDSRFNSR